jgi:bis(5'-nucleosyl)-tetraphosphatase (symmetrical)
MATYAIGDIQGCYSTLQRLLERLRFDPARDRLWLVGDMVNRGPRSLHVLRFALAHDASIIAVLGNHDLHLLALGAGAGRPKQRDRLSSVLRAPDRDELLAWLRRRPLLHREGRCVLVHAGLWPSWSVPHAQRLAHEAESALRGRQWVGVLAGLSGDGPDRSSSRHPRAQRVQATLRILTRLRTLRPRGGMCSDFTGPPAQAPPGCRPWFELPARRRRGVTVVFGHWAALGLLRRPGLVGLDTGCVWGGTLTALRLDDGTLFAEPFADFA